MQDGLGHHVVSSVANRCRGWVTVSYADTDGFREFADDLYPADRWRRVTFEAVQHMRIGRGGAAKGRRTEVLLTNYAPAQGALAMEAS